VRFDAERTDRGHSDEMWSHALAVHAAVDPPGEFDVQTALPRASQTMFRGY
jgi:phage FluMu gp28-like protein